MQITDFLRETFRFDASTVFSELVTLVLALLIALPIGWNRERANRIGVRTFPLVAVASAAYVLLARQTLGPGAEPGHEYILQGLMTGLGFLGAGAIMKNRDRVRGTATATALWSTAAIGAAVAYGKLEIAILLSLVVVGSLRGLEPLQKQITPEQDDSASERERDLAADG